MTNQTNLDFSALPTPCYVMDEGALRRNMEILKSVSDRTGCKILHAQKAFSMFSVYPLMRQYLCGTTASGIYEARLGHDYFGGETHVFNPAYRENDFREIVKICDCILFNNFEQYNKFYPLARDCGRDIKLGIRVNPLYSEVETELYNPCSPNSRLGCTLDSFPEVLPEGITGLHFHALCEQGSDVLERVFDAAEAQFGKYFYGLNWLNFGGGHHITRDGYDIERLVTLIGRVQKKYGLTVYLEPGEASALNAGYLVSSVLDVQNGKAGNVILDTSAECHMPDVLEMPYRPYIIGSGAANEKAYTYRLGGPTCLAGDIIGEYSFDEPLHVGDRLIFTDMAIYSMVKNNTFNGMPLPSIALRHENGRDELIRSFGYEDFLGRL